MNFKAVVTAVAVVAIAYGGYCTYQNYQERQTINWREHKQVRSAYDRAHDVNAQAMEDKTDPVLANMEASGKVDRAALKKAVRPGLEESVGLDNDELSDNAYLDHRIPVIPEKAVRGSQQGWITMAPVFEPVHVIIPPTDTIKPRYNDFEESTAEGIYPDGLPEFHKGKKTVIAADRADRGMDQTQPGNVYEAIGRLCNGGACGEALPMGTDAVVCPGGYFQAWYNGFVEIANIRTLMDFANGVGQYRLTIIPDQFAQQVCATHPGATIVKTQPSLPTAVAQGGTK